MLFVRLIKKYTKDFEYTYGYTHAWDHNEEDPVLDEKSLVKYASVER